MGSNAAENHPISMKWVGKAMENGATLLSVDPRFTRTSAKADFYTALRSGTDIAFLGGMINYIIENNLYFKEYLAYYTNASFILGKNYSFKDGLFSGYNKKTKSYDKSQWAFDKDKDLTRFPRLLEHPKRTCSRFTRLTRPLARRARPGPSCMPWAGLSTQWECKTSGPWPSSSCCWATWELPVVASTP